MRDVARNRAVASKAGKGAGGMFHLQVLERSNTASGFSTVGYTGVAAGRNSPHAQGAPARNVLAATNEVENCEELQRQVTRRR